MTKRFFLMFLAMAAHAVVCSGTEYAEIADGQYYCIEHVRKSLLMTEDFMNGAGVIVTANPENEYCQKWKLEEKGGKYALQNFFTGRYIQPMYAYSQQFQTGTEPYYFTFTKDESTDPFSYAITGDRAMHSNNEAAVVGWYTGNNSQWRMIEITMTEEQLAESAELYSQYKAKKDAYLTLKDNEQTYTQALERYFKDNACTELYPAYQSASDSELASLLQADNLPEQIIAMALKVKNNTWEQYVDGFEHLNERFFRVQDYHIYSDENTWAGILGASNARGRWSNPVGVVVPKSDVAILYVDQDVPKGAVLQLNGISGTDTGSKVWTLHKGVNVIQTTETDHMFMYYKMNNLDADNQIQHLSSFPNIKVHIEGGWVNGYWDETRGMDNEDWKAMISSDSLLQYPYIDIKGQYMCMLMNTEKVIAACPENIKGTMSVWNHIVKEEYRILGVYYTPNDFSDRFNNLMNGFSVTYNFMYASTWGGWYNESTLGTIMNADVMLAGGGALWGPAHEMGHNNQAAMNMIGCTEISNNVFSNAVVWQWGKTTTRGAAPASTFNKFQQGKCWYERDLWERTRLYYQLWQYFYVCRHDEDFYPKLYRALIQDPMKKSGGNFCPAELDELHFAEIVCEVAQMDLTEFFEVYGFFQKPELQQYTINGKTQDAYLVGDYSNYYVTFDDWDAKVAATKAKLAQYNNKGGSNLMFIEDRIQYTVSDERTAHPGYSRTDYGSDVAIGKCGDVGSFTMYDISASSTGNAVDSYYFVVDGNTVAMKGSGAVGYKIYDAEGRLVALSNTNTFTVSDEVAAALTDQTASPAYTMRISQADGQSIILPVALSESRRIEAEALEDAQHQQDFEEGKFLRVLQCKNNGLYATYIDGNLSGENTVLATRSAVELNGFFQVEPGRGANAEFYTIRLADDLDKYVYALNRNDAGNNVCVRDIPSRTPTEDCYWKIVKNGNAYNIIPKGGNCGWNCRGKGVGQWSSNNTDDNRWYLKTTQEAIPASNKVGLYKRTDAYDSALTDFTHDVSASHYTALLSSLQEINLPATGCFYRLRNAVSGKYMTAAGQTIALGTEQGDPGTLFYLGEDNSLRSVLTGMYLDCQNKGASSTALPGTWSMAYGGPIANTLCYRNRGYSVYGAGNTGVGPDSLDRGGSNPNSAGYNWVIEPLLGDANNNGIVNIADIAYIISYLNGEIPQDFNVIAADVNGDGNISLEDLNAILQIIQ